MAVECVLEWLVVVVVAWHWRGDEGPESRDSSSVFESYLESIVVVSVDVANDFQTKWNKKGNSVQVELLVLCLA